MDLYNIPLKMNNIRRKSLGWKPDPLDDRDFLFSAPNPAALKSVYLAHKYKMPAIYDQDVLGSCSANAVAFLVNFDLLNKNCTNPSPVFRPSRLFIYYGSREIIGTINQDSGAHLRDAIKVVGNIGSPSEDLWDYDIKKFKQKPPEVAYRYAAKTKSIVYERLDNSNKASLIQALNDGFPICFGIYLYSSFFGGDVAASGIVPLPKPKEKLEGGHAMCIVGFRDIDDSFIVRNSWGCYDDKTEVLTISGWKLFKDVEKNEIVATLNPKTHYLEYQPVSHYHEYDYEGLLDKYNSDYVDLLVTPNHNMYIGKHWKNDWNFIPSEKISNKHFKFKKDSNWEGEFQKIKKIGNFEINMSDWLEFLGYFISEGHSHYNEYYRNREKTKTYIAGDLIRDIKTGKYLGSENVREKTKLYKNSYLEKYYTIGISQTKKENIEKIQNCLNRLPFKFTKVKGGWTTNTKVLHEELESLGKSYEKYIPKEILQLSKENLFVLYEALMLGDGTEKNGKRCYYTASKALADDFQELCLKIGYAADVSIIDRVGQKTSKGYNYNHKEYQVGIKTKRITPTFSNKIDKTFYKGKVFCLTVPNHLLYVRREGKAVWCGNSSWGEGGYCRIPTSYICDPSYAADFWIIKTVD